MGAYYLAVDIGASSGRHILGWVEDVRLKLEEIYRFKNRMEDKDGHKVWDIDALVDEVVEGIRLAGKSGRVPSYMGIDTWGVDYVLVGKGGERLGDCYGYRDKRCDEGMSAVLDLISFEELYRRGGIQRLSYNTVFQLMADKLYRPELLSEADALLMIPDYINYRLTGVIHQEYTNATTGALVDAKSGEFDKELIKMLGYPEHLFGRLSMPGEPVGRLLPEVKERVGYDLTVLHAASHDTASAVVAVPDLGGDAAYLSSGTWSLLGVENKAPILIPEACRLSFTHEGGYGKSFRFLTNIMGLWIIQSLRHELGDGYSFAELSRMASEFPDGGERINVNDKRLMAPESMTAALFDVIGRDVGLPELLSIVYHSLAELYAEGIRSIEALTKRRVGALHIIGGGSQDAYLNSLTAEAVGIPVYAGPTEATAIGNLAVQMIASGEIGDITEARRMIAGSFDIKQI